MKKDSFPEKGFLFFGENREVFGGSPDLLARMYPGAKCYEVLFGRTEPCVGCPLGKVFSEGERMKFGWQPSSELPAFDLLFTPILNNVGEVVAVAEEVMLASCGVAEGIREEGVKQLEEVHEKLVRERVQDRVEARVRRQRAEEERDFVRLAAHQMQHPIALLRGYLELFLTDPSPINHAILEEELQSLARLVSGMLVFAHNSFLPETEQDRVEVVAAGRQIFDTFVRQHPDRKWKFSSGQGLIFRTGSILQLRQVSELFLENAIKYTEPGDVIEVSVDVVNGGVRARVYDEGRGISAENIKKVFRPFFRESRDKPGAGLGLAIAQKLIEQRGGSVRVESEKGKFTRFEIWVPREIPR